MEPFEIGGIPAILFGEPSIKAYLFIHGKGGARRKPGFAEIACLPVSGDCHRPAGARGCVVK
jgi:hypothetical protein